jgi:hypothetical protein
MKKETPKASKPLTLCKETLRALETSALQHVAGGVPTGASACQPCHL